MDLPPHYMEATDFLVDPLKVLCPSQTAKQFAAEWIIQASSVRTEYDGFIREFC